MAEPNPQLTSLSRARESKITELSNHFANDDLTLEELERRIERVYKAASVAELEDITADLRKAMTIPADMSLEKSSSRSTSVSSPYQTVAGRVLAFMSSTRRVGRWLVPQKLDVVAIMSDTKLDFTHAAMPGSVINIRLRAVMASCKLVVPPNVRVINETHAVMANVRSRASEVLPGDAPATPEMPVIRLTGYALMADVNVVVRRLEEPIYDDDDDD
jgi:hypothetical protein